LKESRSGGVNRDRTVWFGFGRGDPLVRRAPRWLRRRGLTLFMITTSLGPSVGASDPGAESVTIDRAVEGGGRCDAALPCRAARKGAGLPVAMGRAATRRRRCGACHVAWPCWLRAPDLVDEHQVLAGSAPQLPEPPGDAGGGDAGAPAPREWPLLASAGRRARNRLRSAGLYRSLPPSVGHVARRWSDSVPHLDQRADAFGVRCQP
jgi:hypothetical protein